MLIFYDHSSGGIKGFFDRRLFAGIWQVVGSKQKVSGQSDEKQALRTWLSESEYARTT